MNAQRRHMIDQLHQLTSAALEVAQSLATERPDTFDPVEAQDLEDVTVLLRRSTRLAGAMTGQISSDQSDEHLDRLVRRHIESARIAASRLGSTGRHLWAHDTAKRLEEARLHLEIAKDEATADREVTAPRRRCTD